MLTCSSWLPQGLATLSSSCFYKGSYFGPDSAHSGETFGSTFTYIHIIRLRNSASSFIKFPVMVLI
jgi:hypothetical protein